MDAIRAFIAVELPEEIRSQLNDIERQLQARAGEPGRKAVRWVPASNIHLTLKFLGEVSSANLQSLAGMLKAEAARHVPFSFSVSELGAFPNARRPRVIWIGVQAPAELASLQKAIEAEARQLGYPAEDRPFSPHLTLGRISQSARPDEIAQISRALSETTVGHLGDVLVNSLHLFKSDLRPTGAVYTSLYSFTLQ